MRGFNTIIRNSHFQEIHHALGCPWPDEVMAETYRNYFCTGEDTDTAARMRASPHWTGGSIKFGSISFSVTKEGRLALRDFMMQNLHIPARYAVVYKSYSAEDGYNPTIYAASSRSAAKYAAYVASECDWPLTEFMAEIASVKIHSREQNPHLAQKGKV